MAESTTARSSTSSDTGDSGVRSIDSGPSLKCPKSGPGSSKETKRWCTCRGPGSSTSNPNEEHPDEALKVSAGHLFCDACCEELSLKSTNITSHIQSLKHKLKKKKYQSIDLRLPVLLTSGAGTVNIWCTKRSGPFRFYWGTWGWHWACSSAIQWRSAC